VRFWDSSALVPLIVEEDSSAWARGVLKDDPRAVIWALSTVEIRSALARKREEGALNQKAYRLALQRASRLLDSLTHVVVLEPVRQRALRVLDVHRLRAADALQLASALVVSRENPAALSFVTLDSRLALAAEREGFAIQTIDAA
jgi:predicted nucleic acid-binding protein